MCRMMVFAWLTFTTFTANADVEELFGSESYIQSINLMSDCSGTWMFFAAIQRRAGDTAAAERMTELRDRASLAAQYLLQLEDAQRTGDPKPVGSYEPYVVSRLDETLSSLSAHFEQENFDALQVAMNDCAESVAAQESILELLHAPTHQE